MGMFTLHKFGLFIRPNRFVDPFALKFCSLIQHDIGPNFSDGLDFVTYEHSLKRLLLTLNVNTSLTCEISVIGLMFQASRFGHVGNIWGEGKKIVFCD